MILPQLMTSMPRIWRQEELVSSMGSRASERKMYRKVIGPAWWDVHIDILIYWLLFPKVCPKVTADHVLLANLGKLDWMTATLTLSGIWTWGVSPLYSEEEHVTSAVGLLGLALCTSRILLMRGKLVMKWPEPQLKTGPFPHIIRYSAPADRELLRCSLAQ